MTEHPANLLTTDSGIKAFMLVLNSMEAWSHLTPAQRRALTTPNTAPHQRVITRLTELGYWDTDGITTTGRTVALYGSIKAHP